MHFIISIFFPFFFFGEMKYEMDEVFTENGIMASRKANTHKRLNFCEQNTVPTPDYGFWRKDDFL